MTCRRWRTRVWSAGSGAARSAGREPFEAREHRAGRAKQQIARKLATLVPSGGVGVCMDASSTVCALAGSMPPAENLTVVTDGIETFLTLTRDPRVHAYLTGGQKDPNAGSLIGPVASSVAEAVLLRPGVPVGGRASTRYFGTSEFSAEECEIKRLMAELSDHVVMAVDSQKLGPAPPRGAFPGRDRPDGHRTGGL